MLNEEVRESESVNLSMFFGKSESESFLSCSRGQGLGLCTALYLKGRSNSLRLCCSKLNEGVRMSESVI